MINKRIKKWFGYTGSYALNLSELYRNLSLLQTLLWSVMKWQRACQRHPPPSQWSISMQITFQTFQTHQNQRINKRKQWKPPDIELSSSMTTKPAKSGWCQPSLHFPNYRHTPTSPPAIARVHSPEHTWKAVFEGKVTMTVLNFAADFHFCKNLKWVIIFRLVSVTQLWHNEQGHHSVFSGCPCWACFIR